MGLLDMINFTLAPLVNCLTLLIPQEIGVAAHRAAANREALLDGTDKERVEANLKFIAETCQRLLLRSAENRLERIFTTLRLQPFPYWELANELNILSEAIHDDIKTEYFFHYPREKTLMLMAVPGGWASALKVEAFPSIEPEVKAGVDCYAIGHNTACVFHVMRVAETGMRALARERQVSFPKHPLEWAEWENILDQIESKARAATIGMPRGPERDAARAFYTSAVAQLRAFKETRNAIMHMRGSFDELDAQRTINQVRDFMNGLSAKIGEKTRRPIRRWP
jgi:hypothetical protein